MEEEEEEEMERRKEEVNGCQGGAGEKDREVLLIMEATKIMFSLIGFQ